MCSGVGRDRRVCGSMRTWAEPTGSRLRVVHILSEDALCGSHGVFVAPYRTVLAGSFRDVQCAAGPQLRSRTQSRVVSCAGQACIVLAYAV